MTENTLACILGGTVILATAAMGVIACSSDTKPGGDPTPTTDGGNNPGKDSGGGGTDAGGGGTDSSVRDAAAECGNPSKNPFVPYTSATGPYCPFQALLGDGGRPGPCATSEHCCIYPQGASRESTCNATASACADAGVTGTTDWQCNEDSDCTTGQVCCFGGEVVEKAECPGDNFARGAKGTFCRAGTTCAAGETKICWRERLDGGDGGDAAAFNAGCAAGQRCVAFSTKAINLGACLP